MQRMRARAAVDVLKRYRQQAELQRDHELGKALARLERGGDPAQVMAEMARALTNKLLHEPSVQLKRMSAEGRTESLSLAINRKSTRLNSSHVRISYAVFCLKKKINKQERVRLMHSI